MTPATETIESVDDSWLAAQKIGFAAFGLHTSYLRYKRNDLNADTLVECADWIEANVLSFPPSVLHLVSQALSTIPYADLPVRLRGLQSTVEGSLAYLTGQSEEASCGPINAAEIIVHNLINTKGSGRQLLKLARTVSHGSYLRLYPCEETLQRISTLLDRCREVNALTRDRLRAATELSALLERREAWAQVRNVLYHQFLSWPTFVLEAQEGNSGRSDAASDNCPAFALPVIVDVLFAPENPNAIEVEGDESAGRDQGSGSQLRSHIDKAMTAAKNLWLWSNRTRPQVFRRAVRDAAVRVNVALAHEIIGNRRLTGASAEAYFTQVLLRRLTSAALCGLSSGATGDLARIVKVDQVPADFQWSECEKLSKKGLLEYGRPAALGRSFDARSLIITWKGSLDKPRHTSRGHGKQAPGTPSKMELTLRQLSEDLTYHATVRHACRQRSNIVLRAPGGLPGKIDFFQASRFFERIVLSRDAVRDFRKYLVRLKESGRAGTMTAEMLFMDRLDQMADVMQVGGWRQYRYVRCPDLQVGLHEKHHHHQSGLLDADHPDLELIRQHLRASPTAITDTLPDHYTPQAILSALIRANSALSYLCIRLVPKETDERFWHVLWTATGATLEQFLRFARSSGTEEAAELLDELLTACSLPTGSSPGFSAPDVVILLGTKQLEDGTERTPARQRPLFDVLSVLQSLKRRQLRVRSKLAPVVGVTRIICVSNDQELQLTWPPDKEPCKLDHELLTAFSVFRNGFTQQIGSVMLAILDWYQTNERSRASLFNRRALELRGATLRDKLEELAANGYLTYGHGVYWVPPNLREHYRAGTSFDKLAILHYAAGVAHAPYSSRTPVYGLPFDLAFLPQHVHEATYHFETCVDLSDAIKRWPADLAAAAQQHIEFFVEPPNWTTLLRKLDARVDARGAWQQSLTLLQSQRLQPSVVPIDRLQMVLRAGIQFYQSVCNDKQRESSVEEMTDTLEHLGELIREAKASCSSARPEECLLLYSEWAAFLRMNFESLPDRSQEADDLCRDIDRLLSEGADGSVIRGDWFESEGDHEENHERAAKRYASGVRWVPKWYQNWFKGAGAEILGNLADNNCYACKQIETSDSDDTSGRATMVFMKATKGLTGKLRQNLAKGALVRSRWKAGMDYFVNLWWRDPVVRRALISKQKLLRETLGVSLPSDPRPGTSRDTAP